MPACGCLQLPLAILLTRSVSSQGRERDLGSTLQPEVQGRPRRRSPRLVPHACPGMKAPFLRKAKLLKQINHSVKMPWRKNLSTRSAKKLKRRIVPRDEEGNNRHLLSGLCLRSSRPCPPPPAPGEHL